MCSQDKLLRMIPNKSELTSQTLDSIEFKNFNSTIKSTNIKWTH
jgi:hypothetical protein